MEIYFSHSGSGLGRRCSESLAVQHASHKYFFLGINLFLIALSLHRCTRAFSTCREQRLLYLCRVVLASRCGGFSCCGAQALGKQAQQMWHMALVARCR